MDQELEHYFAKELLTWYRYHCRDLPWRHTKDPYRIWVSEIMLQQTRVDTAIPYYNRFMERFPDVVTLADAEEAEVLKAWEGLGYYSRARNLQSAARVVAEQYGGKLPADKESLRALKGIGPYTVGAIMSIAHGKPEPAVDGNVMRVLSRFFSLHEDIAAPATRKPMEKLAQQLIPEGEARDFNQALMEFGALCCTPKSPVCMACPIMERCIARQEGLELQLPNKKKSLPPKAEQRAAVWLIRRNPADGQAEVLVRRRPATGLLAKLWELPHVHLAEQAQEAHKASGTPEADGWRETYEARETREDEVLVRSDGIAQVAAEPFGYADLFEDHLREDGWLLANEAVKWAEVESTVFRHVFSHLVWTMSVQTAILQDQAVLTSLPAGYQWMPVEEVGASASRAFPNVMIRIAAHMRRV